LIEKLASAIYYFYIHYLVRGSKHKYDYMIHAPS